MSLIADAIQPHLIFGLTRVNGHQTRPTLPDLIGGQAIFGFDLDFDNSTKSIITDFREPSPVLRAFASDGSRFASAAFQTVQNSVTDVLEKQKTAWSIIQTYYAAFYAGHCLLRLLGESCSQFDRSHVTRIVALANALGRVPDFQISATTYRCVIDPSGSIVRSTSIRDGKGGAHEAFWNVFGKRINRLGEEILVGRLGLVERQTIFSKIDDFRRNLCTNSAPFFSHLSIIRNEVQYRHSQKVWLPESLKSSERDQLSRLIGQWQRDPMDVDLNHGLDGTMERFMVSCAFLISLCACLLRRLADRSENPARSFIRLGPLALINK